MGWSKEIGSTLLLEDTSRSRIAAQSSGKNILLLAFILSLFALICWKCSTEDRFLGGFSYLWLLASAIIFHLNFAVAPTIGVPDVCYCSPQFLKTRESELKPLTYTLQRHQAQYFRLGIIGRRLIRQICFLTLTHDPENLPKSFHNVQFCEFSKTSIGGFHCIVMH